MKHHGSGSRTSPFSKPGDSGACVFDASGTIVAMLDAGVGADKARRFFRMHPGVQSGAPPTSLPDNTALPPQTPVPEPFSDWAATSGEDAAPEAVVDITLTTPMAWVLEDIEVVTGLKPTII